MTSGPRTGPRTGPKPRVILLGSGELSGELVIALRRLGATVAAVDSYAGAPAHRVADQALVIPLTDATALLQAARRLQPDFVVINTDVLTPDVLDALDAPAGLAGPAGGPHVVPGARAVRLTADREGMRTLAADELGLPVAPFWFAGSVNELESAAAHAGFPLLVQPVGPAAGGRGSVVTGPETLGPAWRRAGTSRVLVERVVDVEVLVTLLAVRTEAPGGPAIEFCSPIGHLGLDADVPQSWQPQHLSPAATDSARSIAARIVKVLGGRGVFGIELMVNGDEVYFAGVTSRPLGSAWVTVCSQRLSAFELQARAILGLPVDTMMASPAAARAVPWDSNGVAPTAWALSGALRVPESDVRLFHRPDMRRTLGVTLATGPEVDVARERAQRAAAALAVPHSRG
ncbi:MAG: formate-dependent phosphoribosylglycinamide formyltransferase [Mycobacterium sp.]